MTPSSAQKTSSLETLHPFGLRFMSCCSTLLSTMIDFLLHLAGVKLRSPLLIIKPWEWRGNAEAAFEPRTVFDPFLH